MPKALVSSMAEVTMTSTPEFAATHCRCGGGLCIIKASTRHDGRLYYSCPVIHGSSCRYFKWCDEMGVGEISHSRPQPYPVCTCRTGMCRVELQRSGPNTGRQFFACPIPRGQGSCNFFQWKNDYDEINLSEIFEDGLVLCESTSEEGLSV